MLKRVLGLWAELAGSSRSGATVVQKVCFWRPHNQLILVGAQAGALLMVAVSLDRLMAVRFFAFHYGLDAG
jgi:hypothetical protein